VTPLVLSSYRYPILRNTGLAVPAGVWLLFAAAAWTAPQASETTFRTKTDLVLVPFEFVPRAGSIASLKPADVVLLEDGAPRELTIFEPPAKHRELRLVVVFDATTQKAGGFWDPEALQKLAKGWDIASAHALFEDAHADAIRTSVYVLEQARLQRLCGDVSDAEELAHALHRLADPIDLRRTLDLAASDPTAASGPRALTAAIAALRDSAAGSASALRVLVIISNGAEAGASTIRSVADEASTSNVPVYPVALAHHLVVLNAGGQVDRRELPFDEDFQRLGGLTGGHAFEAADAMSAGEMRDIIKKVEVHALAHARAQYVVGFTAAASDKSRDHRLEVKLASKSSGRVTGGKKTVRY
jgi:hypothetical protein